MAEARPISFDRPFYMQKELHSQALDKELSTLNPKEDSLSQLDPWQGSDQDPWLAAVTSPTKKKSPSVKPLSDNPSKMLLPTDQEVIDFDTPAYATSRTLSSTPDTVTQTQESSSETVIEDPTPLAAADHPSITEQHKPKLPPPGSELSQQNAIDMPRDTSDLMETFQGSVNMLGSIWAKVVDDIYITRQLGNERTAETFGTYVKKRETINADYFDKIQKMHENVEKSATWSLLGRIVEFLSISAGIIGGITLIANGQVPLGTQLLSSSALSLSAFTLKQMKYNSVYTTALSLSGSLLTGWGIRQGIKIDAIKSLFKDFVTNDTSFEKIIAKLTEISDGALHIASIFTQYVQLGAQKVKHELDRDLNTLSTERIKNRDDLQKTIGSLKMEDLSELCRAASEQLRMKGDVMTRILQGSRI